MPPAGQFFCVTIAIAAAIAQGQTGRLSQLPEQEERLAAPNMQAELKSIAAMKVSADEKLKSAQVVRFASVAREDPDRCFSSPRRIVRLKPGEDWPDATETSYAVALDSTGKPMALADSPTSCSGDWSNTHTHYFDPSGRTIAYERSSGFFSGCDNGANRETAVSFYTLKGTLFAREYSLMDSDGRKLPAAGCRDLVYRFAYTIHVSWTVAARAAGLPTVIR